LVPFGTLFIITMQRFRLIKQGKESFGFQDYRKWLQSAVFVGIKPG
jgi:hypothetical protein